MTTEEQLSVILRVHELMDGGSSLRGACSAVGIPASTARRWAAAAGVEFVARTTDKNQTAAAGRARRRYGRERRDRQREMAADLLDRQMAQLERDMRKRDGNHLEQAQRLQRLVVTAAVLQDKDISDRMSGGSLPLEEPVEVEDFTLEGKKRLDELAARRETA